MKSLIKKIILNESGGLSIYNGSCEKARERMSTDVI